MSRELSRRRFLGEASCAAVGSTAMFSTMLNLELGARAAAAQLAPPDDYKALVCVFLAGGNDSYNMLVPTDDLHYEAYTRARGNIALRKDDEEPLLGPILDLDRHPDDDPQRSFGVHPSMAEVQNLFNDGNLSFVANVGTLIEPIADREAYLSGKFRLPHALYSHNDQIAQWQTGYSEGALRSGWAGRAQDLLKSTNPNPRLAMNISVGGTNMWQTGINSTFFSINADGSVALTGKDAAPASLDRIRYETVGWDASQANTFSGQTYQNLFQEAYLNELRRSTSTDREFAEGFGAVELGSPFNPASKLERDLRAVARTIGARDIFDMRRQVFFVIVGGWDHHHELIDTQSQMLGGVSRGLQSFWQSLEEMGVTDNVVTFTASDFGRTLRTNGRGTDHGWGGHQLVMGGPVRGGQIHGTYPTVDQLQLYGPLDTGNGRLIPTTSVDAYAGELATWFGVPPDLLDVVLPNVDRFFTPGPLARPVGFLKDGSEPFEAFASVSCDNFDGRIDLRLINTADAPAEFTIEVTDMPTRVEMLGPADIAEVTVIGRPDREARIRVLKGDFVLLDTTETFVCDPIGPEVDVVTRCSANISNIDVKLTNSSPIDAVYQVLLNGEAIEVLELDSRRSAMLTFMDWPDDTYVLEIMRDGTVVYSEEEVISCKVVEGEIEVSSRCAGGAGRIDVSIANPDDVEATYELRVGAVVRTAVVAAGEARQLAVTGRRDGPLEVVVLRNGFEVHRSSYSIACNVPEFPVLVSTRCIAQQGRIDIALLNEGPDVGEYVVTIGHIERVRTLDPGQSTRFPVTGRRDGDWPVTVMRNGVEIYSATEVVACDLLQ